MLENDGSESGLQRLTYRRLLAQCSKNVSESWNKNRFTRLFYKNGVLPQYAAEQDTRIQSNTLLQLAWTNMAPKVHIFCVPFPGAGHAINMFNAATTIANHEIATHVLVMSMKDGEKWLKATGQGDNPNMHLELLADGKWEDWHPEEPRELVMQIRSPEFDQAVRTTIEEVRHRFPSDRATALVCNALMGTMPETAKAYQLQLYVLNPTAGKSSFLE